MRLSDVHLCKPWISAMSHAEVSNRLSAGNIDSCQSNSLILWSRRLSLLQYTNCTSLILASFWEFNSSAFKNFKCLFGVNIRANGLQVQLFCLGCHFCHVHLRVYPSQNFCTTCAQCFCPQAFAGTLRAGITHLPIGPSKPMNWHGGKFNGNWTELLSK